MASFLDDGTASSLLWSGDGAWHAGSQTALSGQKQTVIAQAISGDYRIDVLLDTPDSRWNKSSPAGSAVEITYGFGTVAPAYGGADDVRNWSAFTAEQVAATRDIIARLSEVTTITFREVADSAVSYGTVRFHNNSQGGKSAGYAYSPDAGSELAGDVFINNDTAANLSGLTRGSYAYSTIAHELLHAIGLKHPGNYNAGEPASAVPGNFLVETEDNYSNSLMSYITFGDQNLNRDLLGPYDLLALQYLYGAKAYRPGDTVIPFGDADGQYLSMIVDNGGRDTIDASRSSGGVAINLNQGASSSVGRTADGAAAVSNVQMAFNTVIENAIGTALADRFVGNAANNVFRTNGGSDTVDGGAGIDTVTIAAARASVNESRTALIVGVDTVTMTNVERVAFSDALVAYDTGETGNAGIIFRLYQAAFNRAPDLGGVSFWINAFDNGSALDTIAKGFTGSQEFRTIYGASPSNSQIVGTYYQNVLHRAGEQGGVDFWVGQLNSGVGADRVLTLFANSPENISLTAPSLVNGLALDASAFMLIA